MIQTGNFQEIQTLQAKNTISKNRLNIHNLNKSQTPRIDLQL